MQSNDEDNNSNNIVLNWQMFPELSRLRFYAAPCNNEAIVHASFVCIVNRQPTTITRGFTYIILNSPFTTNAPDLKISGEIYLKICAFTPIKSDGLFRN